MGQMRFKQLKQCKCGEEMLTLPQDAKRHAPKDGTDGWYFTCSALGCGSTLFAKLDAVEEVCDCSQCLYDAETACSFDCDLGEECPGCYESRQEREEQEFESKKALGYL